MRTIVRVLPRLVLLGVAGGALLVLAERAQEAHAQASDPPAAPASPSVPSPELPDPAIPLDGVLELSAAPAPATPVPADALDRAPSVPVAGPAPSRVELAATGEPLAGIDVGFLPARGPPTEAPGSPHPCPGGGSPHPTPADPAAHLSPGVDRASRRTGLLADARVYASTLLRDPLLRPD